VRIVLISQADRSCLDRNHFAPFFRPCQVYNPLMLWNRKKRDKQFEEIEARLYRILFLLNEVLKRLPPPAATAAKITVNMGKPTDKP